jgi:hypothetical protein
MWRSISVALQPDLEQLAAGRGEAMDVRPKDLGGRGRDHFEVGSDHGFSSDKGNYK